MGRKQRLSADSAPLTDGPTGEATISGLAYGGNGVARLDGLVVFVPNAAPGDRSRIRVTRKHRSFAEGVAEAILEPGPERRVPPCPYYEACGGCQLMHLTYAGQLEAKRGFVADALRRIGHQTVVPDEPVGAAGEFAYRRRATIRAEHSAAGRKLGFFQKESHAVVDIPHCMVLFPALASAVEQLRKLFIEAPDPGRDLEFKVMATCDAPGQVHFTYHISRADLLWMHPLAEAVQERCGAAYQLLDEHGADAGAGVNRTYSYSLNLPEKRAIQYEFEPGAFTQIHFEQNQKLVQLVMELVGTGSIGRVLDLYCGIGNYALPLGLTAQSVLGVESSPAAVEAARRNAQREGIAAVFEQETAARMVRRLIEANERFDTVLLNPTRAGAEGVFPDLARLQPERIVYVSCDPTTLARDIARLAPAGYALQRAVPMDLFPQTYHVESVALITRSDRGEEK